MTKIDVLHITESFGGGVASAISQFVRSTPHYTHALLRRTRPEHTQDESETLYSYISELPAGLLGATKAIRRVVDEIQPRVIHAHSSFAGLYTRVGISPREARVVYSPHCFAFERTDIDPIARAIYRLAERILAHRTTVIAACSLWEAETASKMSAKEPEVYVPNVVAGLSTPPQQNIQPGVRIIAGGRLSPQKDPATFARIVHLVAQQHADAEAIWVGGGNDPKRRAGLLEANVTVTGWLPRDEAISAISQASVYVHTAAWEGFPMAILEAVAIDRPVIARRIQAMKGAPEDWLFDQEEEAAQLISVLVSQPEMLQRNKGDWRRWLAFNTEEQQRIALETAWKLS